jgi:hypothetical protein
MGVFMWFAHHFGMRSPIRRELCVRVGPRYPQGHGVGNQSDPDRWLRCVFNKAAPLGVVDLSCDLPGRIFRPKKPSMGLHRLSPLFESPAPLPE